MSQRHTLISQYRWVSLYKGYRDEPFVQTDAGAFIVAINDAKEVLLTVEPSVTDNQPVLMLPGGVVEEGEDPAWCANRELQEEIGYKAQQIHFLAKLDLNRKYMIWSMYIYLGWDLLPSKLEGDEIYQINIERVPLDDFEGLIDSGRLVDTTVIASLYLARSFMRRKRS